MSILSEGTILGGQYRIVGPPLGHGGFAITYPGWEAGANRPVAIKELFPSWGNGGCLRTDDGKTVLPAHPSEFAIQRERFFREGIILQEIDHPAVVQIYNTFEENGTVYLIMEFIQGQTLSDRCTGAPLSPTEALGFFTRLADALEVVHGCGVLHRDVNPKNVLLTRSGPVLIGFGLARQDASDSETLTAAACAGFAPLEQYSSKGMRGPFVDVYALSALLYLMLTGQIPEPSISRFDPDTGEDQLTPPQTHRSSLEPWLCEGVLAGLTLGASKRPQSISDLRKHLQRPEPAPRIVLPDTAASLSPVEIAPAGISIEEAVLLSPTYSAPMNLAAYKAQMVRLPGGIFVMGGRLSDEQPLRRIWLAPFLMGRTPVTVGMWIEYCKVHNLKMPSLPPYPVWRNGWGKILNHPIVNISWEECCDYARWAHLQLPTEAQWEYSARGGLTKLNQASNITENDFDISYPWGDNCNLQKIWCSTSQMHDAGGTAALDRSDRTYVNGFGLIDISGNVEELCLDWYAERYLENDLSDPRGVSIGTERVTRGGNWAHTKGPIFGCSFRTSQAPDMKYDGGGFRLTRPI